jgi:D-glycerate 3-kinase
VTLEFYERFLNEHQLPDSYIESAQHNFEPVAERILLNAQSSQRPYFVGINGCQGSGKTTLTDFLSAWLEAQGLNIASMSLDDFYLTKKERLSLAHKVHPLFITRGVPGTHDTRLMTHVFEALANNVLPVQIPRFNKATDDRVETDQWTVIDKPVDVVIIEGWCWGASHQENEALIHPVNALERDEDPALGWRNYVNQALKADYEPLHAWMDTWLMLKAPSFDCVYQWRLEQETKLAQSLEAKQDGSGVMSSEEIQRFIQFYQRITESLLQTLPQCADVVWQLDAQRNIKNCVTNNTFSRQEGETA